MSTSVLDSVLQMQREREQVAQASYRELISTLASNPKKPPSPAEIESVLIASRHSVEDLAQEVKRIQTREALRAEIRDIDAKQTDRAELVAQIEAHKAELEAAQAKYREAVFPLQRSLDDINHLHHRRLAAALELRETMTPEEEKKIKEAGDAIQAVSRRRDEQTRVVREMRARLSSSDQGIREMAVGQVERSEKLLKELEEEVTRLVAEQNRLLKEVTVG